MKVHFQTFRKVERERGVVAPCMLAQLPRASSRVSLLITCNILCRESLEYPPRAQQPHLVAEHKLPPTTGVTRGEKKIDLVCGCSRVLSSIIIINLLLLNTKTVKANQNR